MIRNLKILGLAVVALCAFATSAQAVEFHSEIEPTRLTVGNDGTEGTATAHQVFEVEGSPITCEGIKGTGTASKKTEATQTIEPEYTGCTFFGVSVTVNMNGCDYVFNAAGTVTIGSKAGRNCATEPISYNASGICQVTVGSQGPLNGIKFHNVGEEVTVEANVKGISGKKDGFFCPGGEGPFTNGEYTTGNAIVTGEEDNATARMKKIWVE